MSRLCQYDLRVALDGAPGAERQWRDRPSRDHDELRRERHRHHRTAVEQGVRLEAAESCLCEYLSEGAERLDVDEQRRGDDLPAEDDADRRSTRTTRDETPRARKSARALASASQAALSASSMALGASSDPANTSDDVAVTVKPMPTSTQTSARPAGMRAA